jgi:hypothetical protein
MRHSDYHSLPAMLPAYACICLCTSYELMYRRVAAAIPLTFFVSSSPMSSKPRSTLSRYDRPVLSSSSGLSRRNLLAVASVSVAIAAIVSLTCSTSSLNGLSDGMPVPIDTRHFTLPSSGSGPYVSCAWSLRQLRLVPHLIHQVFCACRPIHKLLAQPDHCDRVEERGGR